MTFKSEAQRRWYFANYGGGSSGGSSKSYKPGTDPVKTLYKQDEQAMRNAVEHGNKIIYEDKKDFEEINKWKNQSVDTKTIYFNEQKGKYIPERQKLHSKLINKVDNKNAIPKEGKEPKVVFIGGLTASGKSTAVKDLIDRDRKKPEHKSYKDFVYLNSDTFKEWLKPDYVGYNANYVHRESNDILNKAINKYRKQGKNIIIDATLRRTDDAKKQMEDFDKAGYKIILYGTNIPGEKAIIRASYRFKEEGRYVPLEMIEKNAEATNKSVLELRHEADSYKVMNTDVPRGEKPKLIESTKSIALDRSQTAEEVVNTEEEWRERGTEQVDLKGYDTKNYKKVKN